MPKPHMIGTAGAFALTADRIAGEIRDLDLIAAVRIGRDDRAEDQRVVVPVRLHKQDVGFVKRFLPGDRLRGNVPLIVGEQLCHVALALQHGHTDLADAFLRKNR